MSRPIEKRANIERGVVEVVCRKGLHATSIQDIADAAQVSPGLLYRYWANRDQLAGSVYKHHYLELMSLLRAAAAAHADVAPGLRAMVRAFFDWAETNPLLLRFLLLSQHELASYVPPASSAMELLRDVVTRGIAAGEIRDVDRDLAVELVVGCVLQPTIGSLYGHVSQPIGAHFEAIMAALERAIFDERRKRAPRV